MAEGLLGLLRLALEPVVGAGRGLEAAVHRQVHARGEHRVDEGVGVAHHHEAVAAAELGVVGVVAGGGGAFHERGVLQPRGQLGRQRDGLHQEVFERGALAPLEVGRRGHGAHAHGAVLQRDVPEPAVVEPEERNVALEAARPALGVGEVAVQRRARMLAVALLGVELVRQQRVAPAGVDHEARAPFGLGAVVGLDLHQRAVVGRSLAGVHVDAGDAPALEGARAALAGVAEQQLVEFRTAHVHRIGKALVHRLAEVEVAAVVVPGRDELGAVLAQADGLDLGAHAEPVEQRHVHRQQGFADVKARVLRLLEQHHVVALVCEQGSHRGARRASADDHDIRLGAGERSGCHSMSLRVVLWLWTLVRRTARAARICPPETGVLKFSESADPLDQAEDRGSRRSPREKRPRFCGSLIARQNLGDFSNGCIPVPR
ncbi:hypothetical protein D9M72_294310 [compost metagenome]